MTTGENGEDDREGNENEDGVTASTELRSNNMIINFRSSYTAIADLTKIKSRLKTICY